MNRDVIVALAAVAAAKACERRGCTCIPEERSRFLADGVMVVDILHEPDCQALRRKEPT